jgi:hypothetical protein
MAMRQPSSFGPVFAAGLLLAAPAWAEDDLELRWSTTLFGQYTHLQSEEASDDVTGFFDQWRFVPNKSSDAPIELGIFDASLDLFAPGETPLIQFRLESPTSNLGVSGSQIDQPFLNQRADLLGRYKGLALDFRYRRIRTQDLRRYTNNAGTGLLFDDLTNPDDVYNTDRTGFYGDLRARLDDLLSGKSDLIGKLAPELSLRGGYDSRPGKRQDLFLLAPSNRWLGLTQDLDEKVSDVGGGVLLAPWELLTATFDFDYQTFRNNEPATLEGGLGVPPPAGVRTIDFIPDTDRSTGTIRLKSRLGDRAVLEGGFQATLLEQVGDFTPAQEAAGLTDNSLLYYSANLTADVAIVDRVSANGFFKFDQRDNDIQRDTALFNPATQVNEFLQSWWRILAGVEGVYRFSSANRVALGARFEFIDRTLDFAPPGVGVERILQPNAFVQADTEMYTIYGRADMRILSAVKLFTELGYRFAPQTGYITNLDDYFYGKLRASYAIPLPKVVLLSAFAEGGTGSNHHFSVVDGIGPVPPGPELQRRFDRYSYLWGLTASSAPFKRLSLYGSFFMARDNQDEELTFSSLQRYFQDIAPIAFVPDGSADFVNDQLSFILGTRLQLTEALDAGLAYTYTQADATYQPTSPSAALTTIADNSIVNSDIQQLQFEIGYWIRDGLRVLAGYGLQLYDDNAPLPDPQTSVVPPFDLSETRHIVTLGVTLNSDLFRRND